MRSAATLTVERLRPDCAEVVLDMHLLQVTSVAVDGQPVTDYSVRPFSSYGSALHVPLPPAAAAADGGSGGAAVSSCRVRVEYLTSPESPSLDWMEPSQTAGKAHSFLFSQGQSVLNRSFFPCQDSCSVRITYTARVVVPAPYVVLMVRFD